MGKLFGGLLCGLPQSGIHSGPNKQHRSQCRDPTRCVQLRAASLCDRRRVYPCATAWNANAARAPLLSIRRFRREQVTFAGKDTAWKRTAESGNVLTFHFCPICGSTVYWGSEGFPGHVAVAIGTFADPSFPPPTIAVWEEFRHPWVSLPADTPPKRVAHQG